MNIATISKQKNIAIWTTWENLILKLE